VKVDEVISLVTNMGFPVTICFVLLRYILQTMGERFDKLDNSLNRLTKAIREIDSKNKVKNVDSDKLGDNAQEERKRIN
jgi:hypothetical protein